MGSLRFRTGKILLVALALASCSCCTTISATVAAAFSFSNTPITVRAFSNNIIRPQSQQGIREETNNNNYGSSSSSSWRTLRSRSRHRRQFRLFSSKPPPPRPDFFRGAPSTPGFKPGQFEKLSSWATSTAANRPIVTEYDPDGFWLWTQWEGTTREMAYKSILFSVFWALVVDIYAYQHYTIYIIATAAVNGGDVSELVNNLSWVSFDIPHSKDTFIETLTALNSLWEYQLNLTIFTLSFFVNHAYDSWKRVYFCTRAIQGRLNDLCLLVTLAAKRTAYYGDVEGTTGYQATIDNLDGNTITESNSHRDSKRLVQDVTRMLRMSHVFFWAAHPTCSDGFGDVHHTEGGMMGMDENGNSLIPQDFDPSQYGPMLLSTEGLKMLVNYEQITEREMEALIATGLPPSQYPYVYMEWAALRCMDGMAAGELRGGPGMEENLLKYFTQLRAEYFSIGDFASGRMPMAYVQMMEVLVDTLTFLAPLALYAKMGTFNIISTGLLTLFFKGLLELSKSFLDPFGREGYRTHNIRVDVLVSEMNFGASSRWVDAGDALPSELLERSESNQSATTTEAVQQQPVQESPLTEWMADDYDRLTKDDWSGVTDSFNALDSNVENAGDEDSSDINGLQGEGRRFKGMSLTEEAPITTDEGKATDRVDGGD